MTPEKFNDMKLSVTMLGALIGEMELEAFLHRMAMAEFDIPSDPRQLQNLEILASALLRVKEAAVKVRSEEERKHDLERLRTAGPIEEAERLVGQFVQVKS